MPSFVLASSSRRRAALLSDAGFKFEIAPPRHAEKFDATLTIRELTQWNAIRKGMSLRRLSGRTHEVCSAVLIYHQTSGRSAVFHDISRVRFRRLNRAMIDKYVAKVDPLDKAGAYAAQGSGAEIIAKINGSFTNVVGLPMEKTIDALAKFGIRPRKS